MRVALPSVTDSVNYQFMKNKTLVACAITISLVALPALAEEPGRAELAESKVRTVYLSVDGMG